MLRVGISKGTNAIDEELTRLGKWREIIRDASFEPLIINFVLIIQESVLISAEAESKTDEWSGDRWDGGDNHLTT